MSSKSDTLKVVVNKTHLGPAKGKKDGRAIISASANKARLDNKLAVKFNKEEKESDSKESKTNSQPEVNRSLVINLTSDLAGEDAVYYMMAWDLLYKGPGEPAYITKANLLSKVRGETYQELGINLKPGDKAPILTEEQKVTYNQKVYPFSFDYYELALSFKQSGKRSVRSKSYRVLNNPDLERISQRLEDKVKELRKTYSVILKQSPQDENSSSSEEESNSDN
jgi:hypothetical protein